MLSKITEPEFDVVIVGSGVAGALAAHRLAQANKRVLLLEAGGVAPDSLGRYELLNSYIGSASKATDAPFCGDNVLASQPDPRKPSDAKRYTGDNYYDYDPANRGDAFLSFYERLVGGSTWHWQGIYLRMLPNDFKMKHRYDVGLDWPIDYRDLERWYAEAEKEIGVAGSDEEVKRYFTPRFGIGPIGYPMPALVPSYLDQQVAIALRRAKLHDPTGHLLRVTTVPHAINSRFRDGRPACDGRTSCVPLCPIKARYEAVFHIEKALARGAVLRTQAVVTKLDVDETGKRVKGVYYRRWQWNDSKKARERSGEDQYVSGRIIVLAANGIENPAILLRSGAGNSSGRVGWYLMDHPIKQSYGLTKEPLYPFRGPQTTSDIEGYRDGAFRQNYAAFKTSIKNDGWASTGTGAPRGNVLPAQKDVDWHPGTLLDFVQNWGLAGRQLRNKINYHAVRQITLNSACEQLPDEKNRVELSKNLDELGIERPLIRYRVDDERGYVRQSFKKIIELHGQVFKAMGVDQFKLQDDGDKALTYGGSGHIMGTTLMGMDAKSSVVDKNCRSHDHRNLFVLGSSAFPTSSTANPTSTIAALALRAADEIVKQLQRRS
jgi:glucose dehydrogenase